MATSTTKSIYWQGVRDGAPFVLVVAPFALLFGVVATEAGLHVLETLVFSLAVFAGAAQFTALQLMQADTPTIVVLASALAVNMRMAMYSASMTPYLGGLPLWRRAVAAYLLVDQSYAVSIVRFERDGAMTPIQRFAYFMGTITPVWPSWYAFTMLGALIGTAVPGEWALDFARPITFLALTAPMLRTLAHVVAAAVSVVAALLLVWLPFNTGLLAAATLGMIAGARSELWMTRRARTEGAA